MRHGLIAVVLAAVGCLNSITMAQDDLAGTWRLTLRDDGISIKCGLELAQSNDAWTATLINGQERIPIQATVESKSVVLSIPHYDSELSLDVVRDDAGVPVMNGHWKKRRGMDEWVRMNAQATFGETPTADEISAKRFVGRWEVQFSESEDPAVGIFAVAGDGSLTGTFLTTTGDYRFLAGRASGNRMTLSCFDGAHAFAFVGELDDEEVLRGEFWSSNTWHETFTGTRNEDAKLPDSFRQTIVNQKVRLSDFEFPDVNGVPVNLGGEPFEGKPRLVYVFGSWCPNCHDAAAYLSSLEKKYGKRGLSILGIAFELTGQFERDAAQVKKYLERHGCTYPVVIAGTSDKQLASRTFPLLDRVRSYPTTVFIDRGGRVTAVHTGFTGPATGDAYTELQRKFEAEIESILADG